MLGRTSGLGIQRTSSHPSQGTNRASRNGFANQGHHITTPVRPLVKLNSDQFGASASRLYSTDVKLKSAFSKDELQNRSENANLLRLVSSYRRYGHLTADLDPLGLVKRVSPPELELSRYGLDRVSESQEFPLQGLINIEGKQTATLGEIIKHLKASYCDKIGPEFSYIQHANQRRWFADQVEQLETQSLSTDEKKRAWELMAEAEAFDHFMQRKFPFVKRYGLEGTEAMIPALDAIFAQASNSGVTDVVIGMPHRGRLNLLVGLLKYPPRQVFWKVKGNSEFPQGVHGAGDVLSHIGTSVSLDYRGKPLKISLIENPSHLEAIDPVAMGKVRSKQTLMSDSERRKVLCVQIHGDAAFYGQGIVAEMLGLTKLGDFTVGGTVHMIVNNQLGFTTPAHHGRSSRYSADIAKIIDGPALHVNAESPEDVIKVCKLAVDYRQKYQGDVIIDLIGYRRQGHNEMDEPGFTQPVMYKNIRSRASIISIYKETMEREKILSEEEMSQFVKKIDSNYESELQAAGVPSATDQHLKGLWEGFIQPKDITTQVDTGVQVEKLHEISAKSTQFPSSIKIHERLARTFAKARETAVSKNSIDWATAESMAFGSLLQEGYDIRLSGQDTGRGTFSQRHVELTDQDSENRYVPLNHLSSNQGKLQTVNSPLSELAVLAYEYGYAINSPNTLPIWEAQFGDFNNGAQIIIDNFISSGETKWLKQNGMVLLLPHGYDGTGPEHSSGRMERFLTLTDFDTVNPTNPSNLNTNMSIVNVTTPANYFHVLRRQMLRNFRKPLIVFSPKILLRHPQAISKVEDMAPGTHFQPVIADPSVDSSKVERVLLCSGKIYVDLQAERAKRNFSENTAIIRIEELCPFPVEKLRSELNKFSNLKNVTWCQEESQNAGAWNFVNPILRNYYDVKYVGRGPLASAATGISTVHKKESEDIFNAAFSS
eukprot:TRINITY_DN17154_c0_g1_i1.p1 TRINITY_DN17154_c0_g1~~TRINITY_DN17154_c0_g1_i1.p1  ORF type:complete len:948 (-),score=283.69 TRINITY_DN17154_c0_g1_i1:234-3053(-)